MTEETAYWEGFFTGMVVLSVVVVLLYLWITRNNPTLGGELAALSDQLLDKCHRDAELDRLASRNSVKLILISTLSVLKWEIKKAGGNHAGLEHVRAHITKAANLLEEPKE